MAPVKEVSKRSRQRPRGRSKAASAPKSLAERLRDETLEIETKEPLQRKILRALGASEAAPSDLNRQLPETKEAISRLLGKLLQTGLVEYQLVEGDRRRRLYRLTPAGERALGRHRAYGESEALPPAPEASELARAGLENALRMRRQANRLDEAAERMRIVLRQARELQDNELLIDTLAELAATLRQARKQEELDEVMQELEQMTRGAHPSKDLTLVLPAMAHRQYELGRARDDGIADSHERARHLDAAQSLYCQLRRYAEPRRKPTWGQREGWSVLSLASNLRERSYFEQAVERASTAMALFREIDDEYGETRSLFVIGLCLRLMGDLRGAWNHLAQALKLAQEHTFERFQTDTLLQMGDVQRCMGHIESARLLLSEALAQGGRMNLELIQAFALSSLGACAYQEREYDDARVHLNGAQVLFKLSRHREGLALNARRQGAVRCRLSGELTGARVARLEQQLNVTRKQYEKLRSPAGAAACDIDLGRVRLLAVTDPVIEIARLMARLEDPPQRNLIELDPWVPTYLFEFSKETGDRALRGSAKGVVADGLRRRCDWFSQRGAGATEDAPVAKVDKSILEMGSEPRHESYRVGSEIDLKTSTSPTAGRRLAADLDQARHIALFVPAVGSIHAIAR
jgi:DNA-binding MarR family transcriptional regulator